MKAICTQENFKNAIFNSERVVSKQNTLPILNNILFEAEKGKLKLSATNLEMGVEVVAGAKVENAGKITIPAKLISNFTNNLITKDAGPSLSIETIDQNMKIKSGNIEAIIKGLPANDFPLIPKRKTEFLLKIAIDKIKRVISQVIGSVAINETRQELTGVNMIFEKERVFFAATDSFRLSEKKVDLTEEEKKNDNYEKMINRKNNIIIPANTLLELSRLLSKREDGAVNIAIEESQIFLEVNGTTLISRLINGKYPEYKHIMPKDFKTRAVIEKETIQNAVKMASLFSLGKTNEINIKIDSEKERILIKAQSSELGESKTENEANITGPSQEIVFNPRYILDGISNVSTNKVAILLNGNSSPVALKEIDEKSGKVLDGFTYIVMPIKNQ